MSQYIPGIVDYVPQIQPFKPNLNFFQQVLETKEAQYKAGYDRLSSLYGNLLQSPMLRTENIELRNKFFNDIASEISKVSSMDLSLSQNVEAASKIFQPLIDNDYIMKDMAYTKQSYAELQKAESFRNCTDEKKCGGKYWEGGVRAVQYQMADFAKSSADESLKFTAPRFTPAVNIPKKAMEFAKEMGFNMQTVSWSPDGRYRITTKNGVQMIPSLTDAFMASFGNDQAARDYYATSAYLSRKDFMSGNADKYGSEEAAEAYYLNQMSTDLLGKSLNETKRIDNDIKTAKTKETVGNQLIESVGVDPQNKNDQELITSRNQAIVDQLISNSAKDQHTQTQEVLEPETFTIVDLDSQRNRIDSAVANALFTTDLSKTAEDYAIMTMEQDVQEDKYALAQFDHSLAMARLSAQHKYSMAELSQKHIYDLEMEDRRTQNDILIKSFGEGSNGTANGTFNGESLDWLSSLGINPGLPQLAKEPDLEAADLDAFTTQQQYNENVLQQRSTKIVQVLDNIIKGEVGTVIPGSKDDKVKITKELQDWAKGQKENIFRVAQDKKETVPVEDLPWYKDVANFFLPESSEYTESQEINYKTEGYLDANGNLIPLKDVRDFGTGGDNNGFNLARRQDAFMNDPIAKMVLGNELNVTVGDNSGANPTLGDYNKAYKDSEKLYFTYLDGLRNNMTAVSSATLSAYGKEMTQNVRTTQDYAESMLKALHEGVKNTGTFMTKDQFVNMYMKNADKNSIYESTDESEGVYLYEHYMSEHKEDAEDLYDLYKQNYQDTYNQASGATNKNVQGYRNLKYGFIENAPGGGVQADSRTFTVDSAFRGDQGALDYKEIMRDLGNNQQGALVFKGSDPYNLDLSGGTPFGESADVQKVLQTINGNFISGAKTTDEARARFSMTVHPFIGGNLEKVGVTIKLNPEFKSKNSGSTKTEGALKGTPDQFTIVMDAGSVKADAYQRLKRGPYQLIMDTDPNGYHMNEFSNYGGDLKVTKNSGGGYRAKGTVKAVDENGQIVDVLYDVNSGSTATADQFIPAQYAVLQDISKTVQGYADYLRMNSGNLITDSNFGKPQ